MKLFRRSEYYDYSLIAVILLLIGFGLVMLYSTTSYTAGVRYGNDMFFFRKQAIYSVLAVIAAIAISFLDYHLLWLFGRIIYAGSLIMMILVKSPIGVKVNGATRWITVFGITFQPCEIAKIAVIVVIPVMIIKQGKKFKGVKAILPPLAAGSVQALFAYVFTQNLSTAIIIMMISCAIIFIAHPKTAAFLIAAGGILASVVVVVVLIANDVISTGFRSNRILVWLNPEKYSSKGGYQIMQALYAIGSGGLFGKGLGNSTQKMGALPEAENDMIFSIICEELGIFGGIIIVLLFIYLLYRLFYIAQYAPDLYGSLIVSGVFVHIAAQVILNIGVVLNVLPTTGITLPFVSYGGTSVVLLMMEIAIALSVSMRIQFRTQERDLWGEVVKDYDIG